MTFSASTGWWLAGGVAIAIPSILVEGWDVYLVHEVRAWIDGLDPVTRRRVVAGDKAGRWSSWYAEAIPLAERRFEVYLKERAEEEGDRR
jgi:hypothetical protein